jgi:creatinine amidohydrolase
MRPYFLQENNWDDVRNEDYKVALLPIGATEAHNYHLPYGTDTIMAQKVALDAAKYAWDKGVKSVVLPPIWYGVNNGQMDVKLCMHLNPSTHKIIIKDILTVLNHQGIKRFIIINGHGGNELKYIIRELSLEFPEVLMTYVNWYAAKKDTDYFKNPGDHAGELETSCMLSYRPDIVLPLEKAGEGKAHAIKIKGIKEKWAWVPRKWPLTTEDTGVGCPYGADAEKGKKFTDDCIEEVGKFIVEFGSLENEADMYEK